MFGIRILQPLQPRHPWHGRKRWGVYRQGADGIYYPLKPTWLGGPVNR